MNESEKELMQCLKKEYQDEQILLVRNTDDGDTMLLCYSNKKYSVVVHSNGVRTDYGQSLTNALGHLYPLISRISSSMPLQGGSITASLGTTDKDEFFLLFSALLREGFHKFNYCIDELISQIFRYSIGTQKKDSEDRIDFMNEVRWITEECQKENLVKNIVLARKISTCSHYLLQQIGNQFYVIETTRNQTIYNGSDLLVALGHLYPSGGTISAQMVNRIISSITVTIDTTDLQVFIALVCDLFQKADKEYELDKQDFSYRLSACANFWYV